MAANVVQLTKFLDEPFFDILKDGSNGTMWCRICNTIS